MSADPEVRTIGSFARRALAETWRFLRLFAVGIAWSTPLLLAVAINDNPGVPLHPTLAHGLQPFQFPLLGMAPVAAVVGVALVATLSSRSARLDPLSVVPLLLFVAFAVVTGFVVTDRISMVMWLTAAPLLSLPVLVLVGVLVTARTLGRRSVAVAAAWVLMWAALTWLLWQAGARTPDMEDDLGAGFLLVTVGLGTLAVTWLAAFFGFLISGGFGSVRARLDATEPTADEAESSVYASH